MPQVIEHLGSEFVRACDRLAGHNQIQHGSQKMTPSSYSHGSVQSKGNQIVNVKIDILTKITARQEELLREFDADSEKSSRGISGTRGGCG